MVVESDPVKGVDAAEAGSEVGVGLEERFRLGRGTWRLSFNPALDKIVKRVWILTTVVLVAVDL